MLSGMRLRSVAVALAVLWALACGSKDQRDASQSPQAMQQATPLAAEKKPLPDPAPPAPLSVKLTLRHEAGGLGLSVQNRGDEPVSLARSVTLARNRDGQDTQISGQALVLAANCESEGCVTLAPGAELLAPSWLDIQGAERCGALLSPGPEGNYRLRVSSCDGTRAAELSFTWPR